MRLPGVPGRDHDRAAADEGFDTVWFPQTNGIDALTALAVVAREVTDIHLGTVAHGYKAWGGYGEFSSSASEGAGEEVEVAEYEVVLGDDGDGVANGCDRCEGFDDNDDADLDGIPDGCDACPEGHNRRDLDGDGIDDLVIAEPRARVSGLPDCGRVLVFRGRRRWPSSMEKLQSSTTWAR